MALDQSALLDLLAQLKLTDVTDRILVATEKLHQELIDAKASAGNLLPSTVGASPPSRPVLIRRRDGGLPSWGFHTQS